MMKEFRVTLLGALGMMLNPQCYADINSYFDQIQKKPTQLYQFLKEMPKGGELHYHLAGGPSPEAMLSLVTSNDYCLNKQTFAVSTSNTDCTGIAIKNIQQQSSLYEKIVKSWSMKEFIPGKESRHDHFFNGFMKYMPIVFNYRPQLVAHVIKRAAKQHELYLEIMDIADNAQSTQFGTLLEKTTTFDDKRALLLSNQEFQKNIAATAQNSDQLETQAYEQLHCNKSSKAVAACAVRVKFLYYVLREQPLNNFFAQALNAFEAVSRSKGSLVGVNLVQPEDGVISLQDYHQQMQVFNYMHTLYPKVHIALHAGEITPAFVKAKDLKNHIQDALLTGKAQRIGHGVDIIYEDKANKTASYMAQNNLPVEINLTSNLEILGVSGPSHPLNYYLSHQVPVVLSTDDEGILRTNLTQQYVKAAVEHHLSYYKLKQISRNALTYAFAPGSSIWQNTEGVLVPACTNINSSSCEQFVATSEKAKLQLALEKKFLVFEKKYQERLQVASSRLKHIR
jgi:adenosine deaminase